MPLAEMELQSEIQYTQCSQYLEMEDLLRIVCQGFIIFPLGHGLFLVLG